MGCFPKDGDFGLTHAQADAVKDVFGAIARKKAKVMREEMRESAHALGERRTLRFADGNGGAVEMMVHPVSYHYWGNRLGYGCWQDAEFCREYLRDNEEARVKSRPAELTLVVRGAGGLASSGRKRFHKVYGAGDESQIAECRSQIGGKAQASLSTPNAGARSGAQREAIAA